MWLWGRIGVALRWLWCGFRVALGWLCTPESMPSICLVYGFVVACGGLARQFCILHSTFFLHLGARVAEQPVGSEVMPEFGRFFPGATRAVVQKPTDEANRCNLGHVAPKTLQKALYVGFSQIGRPLQVVWRDMKLQCLLLKYGQFTSKPCVSPQVFYGCDMKMQSSLPNRGCYESLCKWLIGNP